MLRGNIAATSLKILLKNLYSVKCYDKLNINVLTLSLWENFWWGLIYFDQFIFMFSFISFRRNINYLLPRLLNFWKPDTLPRITNCYDVHAYMSQHQYLAFFVYIITVYTSLYYILKHKISKRNNIYVCDGKNRPEHFLFIRLKKNRKLKQLFICILNG